MRSLQAVIYQGESRKLWWTFSAHNFSICTWPDEGFAITLSLTPPPQEWRKVLPLSHGSEAMDLDMAMTMSTAHLHSRLPHSGVHYTTQCSHWQVVPALVNNPSLIFL